MKKVMVLVLIALLFSVMNVYAFAERAVIETETGCLYEAEMDRSIKGTKLFTTQKSLAKPTNLVWNPDGMYGWIQWDAVENCEGAYYICVYCDGELIDEGEWDDMYDFEGDGTVDADLIVDRVFTKSGNYVFSVKALGDYNEYSDSVYAYSDEYNYVHPSKKLATPTNVRWKENGIIIHDSVENAGGYYYAIYNQEYEDVGGLWHVEAEPLGDTGEIEEDLSEYLIEIAGWEEEFEVAYVGVTALTYNVEIFQNSQESDLTDGYEIGKIEISVQSRLEELIYDMYDDAVSAAETLDTFIGYLHDSNTTNTDLALSMQQNEELVALISELEDAYCYETGVGVSVTDACNDTSYLQERGIDVDKVEVIGAGLNAYGENEVTLSFGEADKSVSADELYYKNSVAVDISMDGVQDNQKLTVPVQINMPVPKGVLPDRLVILHYHNDGTMEEIHPAVNYVENEPYVTFVLTSFSNFVFCNVTDMTVVKMHVGNVQLELKGQNYSGVIAAMLYNKEGCAIEVETFIPDETLCTDFENVLQCGNFVKIMWWNSITQMQPVCKAQIVTIE